MDSKVKLKNKKTGFIKVFKFSLAQDILISNSRDFECADDKHKFVNNELIKCAQKKKKTKSKETDK